MAGRGPKPARVKELAGNPGKRPLERDAINPPPAIPPCPEHLNAVAKAEWDRRAPGSRHLPNGRLLAPECTLTCARIHRVPIPSRQTGMNGHVFERCSIVLPSSADDRSHLGNLG